MLLLIGIVCTLLIIAGFVIGFFGILGNEVGTLVGGASLVVAGVAGILYGMFS